MFAGNDLEWVKKGENERDIAAKVLKNMHWMVSEWKKWGTEIVFIDAIPPGCQEK